jgi:hypothetical protein
MIPIINTNNYSYSKGFYLESRVCLVNFVSEEALSGNSIRNPV